MRLGQWVGLIALVVSLYILWEIRQVVLLVFAAVVLATILNRVVRFLQRSGIKRGPAIAITIISLVLITAGTFALIVPQIVEQLQQLIDLLPKVADRIRDWYTIIRARIPGQVLATPQGGLGAIAQNLQSLIARFLGNFFSVLSNSIAVLLNLLLFLVLTIMLLVDPQPYRRVFILAFPAFYRRRVEEIMSECETSLIGWMRGTLFNMLVIGVISYIGLLILGVPLPLINALLAGLLEFIPNLGPALSILPPTLLALLDTPWKAIAVIVLYFLIQQFESLALVPFVMKHEVSLLPVFTILSVVVFSFFFGFLGLFLSIPLLIVTQIWLKEVLVKDVLNRWGEPQPPEDTVPEATPPSAESSSNA